MEKVKILVVDDDKEVSEVTKSFLVKKNYAVFTATSADEAIGIVKKEQPKLVLLDVRLEEVSGIEVLRQIKELDKNIKVIIVTGLGDEETIRQAESFGADDFITKPFTAGFLQDLIAKKLSP